MADDGPGIPPGEREKLFLPYYSTKRRGSGLGLAIVRRIIAEHGGSIEVGDNTPRGTRFYDRAAVLTPTILIVDDEPASAPRSAACCATRATTSRPWRAARRASSA